MDQNCISTCGGVTDNCARRFSVFFSFSFCFWILFSLPCSCSVANPISVVGCLLERMEMDGKRRHQTSKNIMTSKKCWERKLHRSVRCCWGGRVTKGVKWGDCTDWLRSPQLVSDSALDNCDVFSTKAQHSAILLPWKSHIVAFNKTRMALSRWHTSANAQQDPLMPSSVIQCQVVSSCNCLVRILNYQIVDLHQIVLINRYHPP